MPRLASPYLPHRATAGHTLPLALPHLPRLALPRLASPRLTCLACLASPASPRQASPRQATSGQRLALPHLPATKPPPRLALPPTASPASPASPCLAYPVAPYLPRRARQHFTEPILPALILLTDLDVKHSITAVTLRTPFTNTDRKPADVEEVDNLLHG